MPEIKRHEQGKFCWVELATADAAGAKKFYSSLFGWTLEEVPFGEGQTYTKLQKNSKDVAALYGLMPDQRKAGIRSHWAAYLAVDDADEIVKKAVKAGAKAMCPVLDVMDVGRMATLQDPSGAFINVWQAKRHTGAGVIDEHATLGWCELLTNDTAKAEKFYSDVFGWKAEKFKGETTYFEFKLNGKSVAGMMPFPKAATGAVPHWMTYFMVSSCDDFVGKARSSAARICLPPTDIPGVGRISSIEDPQGAVFAVYERKT
ncbi:MAG: VOC family protein [Bdellovibrionia bacterium]